MDSIMGTAVDKFVLGGREALLIWGALTLAAVASFAVLAVTSRREWFGVARAGSRWASRRRQHLTTRYAQLRQTADEITVAARRSARTAERRHRDWLSAITVLGTAWSAFLAADAHERTMAAASTFPIPQRPLRPTDVAERERHLHKTVTEAFNRGDLSIDQMLDALASRNGWNPCLDPADHEVIIARIARQRRLTAYLAASAYERVAWHNVDMATAARRSLADEAFAADLQARQAFIHLAREVPQHRRPSTPLRLRLSGLLGIGTTSEAEISEASLAGSLGSASGSSARATVRLA